MAIVINLAFSLLIAYKGKWQITSSSILAIILLSTVLFDKIETFTMRGRSVLLILATALFFSSYIPALYIRKKIYFEHEALVQAAKTTSDGIIWGTYENEGRTYFDRYRFFTNYFRLVFYMGDTYHKRLLSSYLTNGKNPTLVQCVLPFSPETAESLCTEENQLIPHGTIFKAGPYPFFIIRSNNEADRMENQQVLETFMRLAQQPLNPDGLGVESYSYKDSYYSILYHK